MGDDEIATPRILICRSNGRPSNRPIMKQTNLSEVDLEIGGVYGGRQTDTLCSQLSLWAHSSLRMASEASTVGLSQQKSTCRLRIRLCAKLRIVCPVRLRSAEDSGLPRCLKFDTQFSAAKSRHLKRKNYADGFVFKAHFSGSVLEGKPTGKT